MSHQKTLAQTLVHSMRSKPADEKLPATAVICSLLISAPHMH